MNLRNVAAIALLLCAPVANAAQWGVDGGVTGRLRRVVPQISGVPIREFYIVGPALSLSVTLQHDPRIHVGGALRLVALGGFVETQGVVIARWTPVDTTPMRPVFGVTAGGALSTECISDYCGTAGLVAGAYAGVTGHISTHLQWTMTLEMSLRTGTSPPVTGMPFLWAGLRY